MSTFQERLTLAYNRENNRRREAGEERLTKTMLWKTAGLTSSAASHWFSGENAADMDTCKLIAPLMRVNYVWLFNESEPVTKGVADENDIVFADTSVKMAKMLPVIGVATAGSDRNFLHAQYQEGGIGLLDFPSKYNDSYSLRVEGDSMVPRIKHGEFVVVEPSHDPCPGDEVFVCLKDGRCMIKEYVYKRDGRIRLDSINRDHPTITPKEEEIERMHYVSAIVKSSRFHEIIDTAL